MRELALVLFALGLVVAPAAAVEERIGPEILLDIGTYYVSGGPAVASDGLGAFIVWIADGELRGARIDGAGNVSGPFFLATSATGALFLDPAVASSGHGALVAWAELAGSTNINVLLLDTDGRPVHSGPFTIDRANPYQTPLYVRAAYDGFTYHVVWQRNSNGNPRNFTQRVGTDGSRWTRKTRVKVRGMTPYPYEPNIACLTGQCLVTWLLSTGADRVQGARLVGDKFIDNEVLDLMHNGYAADVVAGDNQYLIVANQRHSCGPTICPVTVGAARVSSAGVALDLDGVPVDNPVGSSPQYVTEARAAFDGQRYLTGFNSQPLSSCGWNIYGARIASDGTVDNPDAPGSVVSDANAAIVMDIAGTRASAVAAWRDQRDASMCGPFSAGSVRAQLVFPHEPVALPVRNIGAIGALSVAEQQTLRFTVGTPGLDPGTTSISVTNLPEGAMFDGATRTFQWLAYANQSGTYTGIHFEASDSSQTISEDVTIAVTESSLSLCGTVYSSGMPTPNVALRIKGGGGKPRTVLSDANGRFCFFHLIQSEYKLALDKLSRADFIGDRVSVVIADGDVDNVPFGVQPRL